MAGGGLLPIRALRACSIPGGGAEWTSWFNIDHPGGDGDYESLEAIRFYYRGRVCERPVAIQARTTEWELPEEVGEVVHASPKRGFRCVNKEQPQGKTCSNYHIRFLCPLGERSAPRLPTPPHPLALWGTPYPLLVTPPPGCCIPPGAARAAAAPEPPPGSSNHPPGCTALGTIPGATELGAGGGIPR